MKKIFATIIIISLLFITNTSHSQVSGFMGKKNVLKLGLFMKSSFVMPNKNGESGYFSFNDKYSIEFERVLTRNKSFQVHASGFNTYYKMLEYTDNLSGLLLKMNCMAFGGDFVMYRSSHIAPLGAYTSLGFDVIVSKSEVNISEINRMYLYSSDPLDQPRFSYPYKELSTTHLGLNVKSGVKQIFFDCLSFDFNFQLGVIFSENMTGGAEFNENVEDYIRGRIGNRLWGHYLWGVNCAVGYLF